VSELVKLLWVVYLAGFLVKRQALVTQSLKGSFVLLILLGLVAGLLLAQPDFGALFVLTSTFGFMLFLGGTRIRDFALLVICLSGLLGLLAVGAPYRMARLVAFIDPWADPFNSGFQLTQSLIAFGRGEVMGVGLGSSIQKLFYLPEAHTDFILAVWAEETGLLGVGLVMGLFGILLFKGFNVAKVADKQGMRFAALLAYGVVLLIGTAAAVNMGVVMGVLPTKGLALPFISYGGSSLLVNCIAFGLLMRVDFETRKNSVSARKKGGR
jgi:cell division protein FtsW